MISKIYISIYEICYNVNLQIHFSLKIYRSFKSLKFVDDILCLILSLPIVFLQVYKVYCLSCCSFYILLPVEISLVIYSFERYVLRVDCLFIYN